MEFENIWKEYERELSSFVLSRVGDVEIQKEIMQEVALKIFTSVHTQKKTSSRLALHPYEKCYK